MGYHNFLQQFSIKLLFSLILFTLIPALEVLSADIATGKIAGVTSITDTNSGPKNNRLRIGLSNPIVFSTNQLRVTVNSVKNVGDTVGDKVDRFQIKPKTMPANKINNHFFLQLEVDLENLNPSMLNFDTEAIVLMNGEMQLKYFTLCEIIGKDKKKACGIASTSLTLGITSRMLLIFIAPDGLTEFDLKIQPLKLWRPTF